MKVLQNLAQQIKIHPIGWISGLMLALLTTLSGVGLLTLSGWFICASAIAGQGDALAFNFMLPAVLIRILTLLRTLGRYAERLVTHEVTFRAIAALRVWFFEQLLPLAPGRLAAKRSSDLLAGLSADIDTLDAVYLRIVLPSILAILVWVGATSILAPFSPHFAVLVSIGFLFIVILIPWYSQVLGRDSTERQLALMANFRIRQIDVLQGWDDLLLNAALARQRSLLDQCSEYLIDAQRRLSWLAALGNALNLFLIHILLIAALLLSAQLRAQGAVEGPQVALIFFTMMAVFEVFQPGVLVWQLGSKVQRAAQRVQAMVSEAPAVHEVAEPKPVPEKWAIQLENLCFRYASEAPWILQNISLQIPQGARIAIVGENGAGKTSLIQLLMRFFDPATGRIKLGDIDLRDMEIEALRSRFAFLPQKSHVFTATLRDNLLLGKANANISELNSAIHASGLTELIASLPEGLDTWVGERGAALSGGEARRVALARVYLKAAPILLLDEPTEGLDSETEHQIWTSLADFAQDKTLILITHRESGLQWVDQVYALRDGRLILQNSK